MAIIKFVNVKSGKPYGVKAVLNYIQNLDKTENGLLISAKDCMQETAFQQMMLTKVSCSQTTGRQYVHIIQSFPVNECLTPEMAHSIGSELLAGFEGHQGVVATHTNRKHIHNHIVLNSVNYKTGKKWQFSKAQLYSLRERSDQLCLQNGLSVVEKGRGWRNYGEHMGQNWKLQLAQHIAQSLGQSRNREDFMHFLNKRGITADFGARNILFTMPDGKKCSSEKLLNYGDFSKSNIERTIQFNYGAILAGMKNRSVITQAFGEIATLFPDRSDDDMTLDFYNGRMPRLEGQALFEWILKKKGSSAVSSESSPKPLAQRQRGLLETINSLIEPQQKNSPPPRPQPVKQIINDRDEWEM